MKKTTRTLLIGIVIGIALAGVVGMMVFWGYHFLRSNGFPNQREQQSEYGETESQTGLVNDVDVFESETIDKKAFAACQSIEMYTYQDLSHDIELLTDIYSKWMSNNTLGITADGRNIYHLKVGSPNAEKKIFINAGIHGREYMTCQLIMKQLITYLDHIEKGDIYDRQQESITYASMWENCMIHIVPMINPDGITISQYGLVGMQKEASRDLIEEIAIREDGYGDVNYFKRWKSNANGVDLNRNFDALWDEYIDGVGCPSADHYKGTYPGCEVESASLIQLTEQEIFDLTISYHTQGSVIYWYFGQEGVLYENTKDLAELVSDTTGYPTYANYESLDPAGYKDWCISKMGIPGLTIEIGTETSPVPVEQFDKIWNENQYVWEELAYWAGHRMR